MINFSSKLKQKLDNKFIKNISWFGGAELIIRVSRLAATVVLARFLTPEDYGLAAIVITIDEFSRTINRMGVNSQIIQADSQELEKICNSAYWFNWFLGISLFAFQVLLAFPAASFYHNPQLILPIIILSIKYLFLPICAVRQALIQRENRLKVSAVATSLQNSSGNILSALFAFLGFGMWAIVLPSILTVPIWILIHYFNHSWHPTQGFSTKGWRGVWNFSKHIYGIELLNTARNYLDYMLIGRFLGVTELGIYFFAFNAGLGISLSIVQGISSAILPYLCEAKPDWDKFKIYFIKSLKTITFIIIPFVFFQSSIAPFYVPILFGEQWIPAVPILILICLSAIPRPYAEAASQMLVAFGKPNLSFIWNVVFTLIFILAIFIGAQWNILGIAGAVLIIHISIIPVFVYFSTRYVWNQIYEMSALKY